jgi:acetyl esterase
MPVIPIDRDGTVAGTTVLDAGYLEFLTALSGAGGPRDASLVDLRAAAAAARLQWQGGGAAMEEIVETEIATVAGPVRIRGYYPGKRRPAPGIVYFHGGGWTLLGLDTHDRIMREYAARSGWAVIGVEFPQAPETPFPGALDTCLAAVRALGAAPGRFGLEPTFALAGDSSGANLALAAALALRDSGAILPGALILNYGVYDHDLTRPSYAVHSRPPLTLSAERMRWFWSNYCPDAGSRDNPLAVPLRANLAGLPPARLVVAGQDVLRDENLAMALRLAEAGNSVSLDFYPAAPHAFIEALALSEVSNIAIRRAADWLNDTMGTMEARGPAE